MFAVLKTGGKQYKVQAGDLLRVELLAAEAGDKVQFNDILMLGGDKLTVGAPFVEGAAVQAEVIDNIKADKVITYHKRRRKHSSQRTRGHRQQLTLLRVTDVLASGADKSGIKEAVGTAIARRAAHGSAAAAPAKKAAPKAAAAVAEADDLKVITGLGPAAEKKLNEAGVTTFAQLAALDAETYDAVKIKAEWVAQAQDLAK